MADDTEARIARAKSLRESIKKVVDEARATKEEKPGSPKPRNPRDAILDRMRELDRKR